MPDTLRPEGPPRLFTYENGLLLLLGISFGVAFFDRNAAGVLIPFISKDLHLTHTQVAWLTSGLAITWALGAYFIGRWSDVTGKRKPFLLAFLVIFSACSFLSGLAPDYPTLLISRVIMGAVEGPFLPVCLALMVAESSPHRRGVNAGFMQNFFAAILGQSVAPLVLVPLAELFGWRAAFYIAGLPGLVCALAVLLWVREPKAAAPAQSLVPAEQEGPRMNMLQMLRIRNVAVCCAIAIFMVPWLLAAWTFYSRFLVEHRDFPAATMGYLLSTLGAAAALSGFGAPWISDRIGRKPVMITFCLLGVITPLTVLYFDGPLIVMGALMFVGWMGCGAFPLFMGVIPGETLSRRYAATAMGLVVCVGEVIGGFGLTSLSGKVADLTSIENALFMQIGCAIVGGLLGFALIETAPAKVRAAQAVRAAA
jgi:MFS family permease